MPLAIVDPHIHLWAPRTTPRLVSPAVKLLGWSSWAMRNVAPKLFPASSLAFVGKTDFVMADYLPEHWQRDTRSPTGDPTGGGPERDLSRTGEASRMASSRTSGFEARGFVHVQAGWHGKGKLGSVGETHWLERICGPELLGIVGHADLGSDSLAQVLDAHAEASRRFVGVRDMLAHDRDRGVMNYDERPERYREAAWQRGFEELGRRNLSFDAWMYHPQLRQFEAVVSAHPNTRVILDHLGTPLGYGGSFAGYGGSKPARQEIAAKWRDDLAALAQHPQVHAKISGLTMPVVGWGFHERPSPPSRTELVECLGPMVETALELFGPQRCMFASNFPMDKVSAAWTSLYEVFDELTRTRDEGERRALFHDNAARVYGLADLLA